MSSGPSERVEWRAVGYDKPENAWMQDAANSYEYGEWQEEREVAEADVAEMRASELPYDDVWLERRTVVVSEIERVAL